MKFKKTLTKISLMAGIIALFGTGGITPKSQAEVESSLIGSAVVEGDGSYWLREKDGWGAYTVDHYKEGSWLGGNSFEKSSGEIKILKGYGEKGRKKLKEYIDNLPSIEFTEQKNHTETKIDGKVFGDLEHYNFFLGMKNLGQRGWDIEEMLENNKLDSVEIYNVMNYGHMRFGINPENDYFTRYLKQEVQAFCQNRIEKFIKEGAKQSDVSDLGILAVFKLEDTLILKGLRDTLKEQDEYNKVHSIPKDSFFIKDELGKPSTYVIDSIKSMSKILHYMDKIPNKDANRLKKIFRDYKMRTNIPFLMEAGNLEIGFFVRNPKDITYQVIVRAERK